MIKKLASIILLSLTTTAYAQNYSGVALSGVNLNVDPQITTTTTTTTSSTTTTLPTGCTWQTAFSAVADECIGGVDNGTACTSDDDCTPPGSCLTTVPDDIHNMSDAIREHRFELPANALDFTGVPTKFRMTLVSSDANQAEIDSNSPIANPNYGMMICESTASQVCNSGTIVPITFNSGAKGVVWTGTVVSDEISAVLDKTKRYLVHLEMDDRSTKEYVAGWLRWYSTGINDYGDDEDTTGLMSLSSPNAVSAVQKIEVCVPDTGEGSNWWNVNYGYRKVLSSSDSHSIYDGTNDYITITMDTVSANIQDDCDDLRIVHHASSGGSDIMTELPRKVAGCNTASTKIYFKLPYYLTTNANLQQTSNKVYVYYGYNSAVCDSAPCNNYTNPNFPQAPLTPVTGTLALWDFETTPSEDPSCKVCTGDASYNDRGCAIDGDCGIGTCTASPDICDLSGIALPHHLQACDYPYSTCATTAGTSTEAAIGIKSLQCTGDNSKILRHPNPTFDDFGSNTTGIVEWWDNATYPGAVQGRTRIWGSSTTYEACVLEASPLVTCNPGDACNYNSQSWTCDETPDPDYCYWNLKHLIDWGNESTSGTTWPANTDWSTNFDGNWHHYRVEVDDNDDPGVANDTDRWRMWIDGQPVEYFGLTTGWFAELNCVGVDDPYPCCTGANAGCPNIGFVATGDPFYICSGYAVPNQQLLGYIDDFRITMNTSPFTLGAPEWIIDPLIPTIGAEEPKP